ncbi:MAG TPA: hypothetical protein VGO22_07245 [Pseudorhizobium sp.]|jgi:hypothetical protein|nr:hypothetical protein [Pseudorhizobium sp.]
MFGWSEGANIPCMKIPAPPTALDAHDRQHLCRTAIKDALQDVVHEAMEAGWGEDEVIAAIGLLADHLLKVNAANDELIRLLEAIHQQRMGKPEASS